MNIRLALKIDTCIAGGANILMLMYGFANEGKVYIPLLLLFACALIHFFVCYLYLLITNPQSLCDFNPFDWRQ